MCCCDAGNVSRGSAKVIFRQELVKYMIERNRATNHQTGGVKGGFHVIISTEKSTHL